MMLFYSFGLLTIILTKISYTLDIKYYSDKLYHDIAKNFTDKSSESADTQIHVLNPKYVKRVELILLKKYGDHEVNYFRNMLKEFQERELNNYNTQPLFDSALRDHVNEHFDDKYVREFHRLDDSSDNSEELVTARIIVKLIKHEFEKFNQIRDQYITPNMERFTQIRHLSQDLHLYTDTPCSTQAGVVLALPMTFLPPWSMFLVICFLFFVVVFSLDQLKCVYLKTFHTLVASHTLLLVNYFNLLTVFGNWLKLLLTFVVSMEVSFFLYPQYSLDIGFGSKFG